MSFKSIVCIVAIGKNKNNRIAIYVNKHLNINLIEFLKVMTRNAIGIVYDITVIWEKILESEKIPQRIIYIALI